MLDKSKVILINHKDSKAKSLIPVDNISHLTKVNYYDTNNKTIHRITIHMKNGQDIHTEDDVINMIENVIKGLKKLPKYNVPKPG